MIFKGGPLSTVFRPVKIVQENFRNRSILVAQACLPTRYVQDSPSHKGSLLNVIVFCLFFFIRFFSIAGHSGQPTSISRGVDPVDQIVPKGRRQIARRDQRFRCLAHRGFFANLCQQQNVQRTHSFVGRVQRHELQRIVSWGKSIQSGKTEKYCCCTALSVSNVAYCSFFFSTPTKHVAHQ